MAAGLLPTRLVEKTFGRLKRCVFTLCLYDTPDTPQLTGGCGRVQRAPRINGEHSISLRKRLHADPWRAEVLARKVTLITTDTASGVIGKRVGQAAMHGDAAEENCSCQQATSGLPPYFFAVI
jgi:hypothetical protein